MLIQKLGTDHIPAVLCGKAADKLCLFIHGKCGNKEEAEGLAEIICPHGFQVLGTDLAEHGGRKDDSAKPAPWEAVPELSGVSDWAVMCKSMRTAGTGFTPTNSLQSGVIS